MAQPKIQEKQLLLFRHGKSDWKAEFDTDHQRPLAKRGIRAAKTMGQWLANLQQTPDLVVTSSAVRAKTTVGLAATAGEWSAPIQTTGALYEATIDEVLSVVRGIDNEVQRLMLVGHEPTWSEFTQTLMGGGQLKVPTAAMVRLDCPISSWQDLGWGMGRLIWLIPPRIFTDQH